MDGYISDDPPITETLLSSEEIAERLSVSKSALAKWRMSGGGPKFVRLGRSVRYRWRDVEAWLKARTRRSTSDNGAESCRRMRT